MSLFDVFYTNRVSENLYVKGDICVRDVTLMQATAVAAVHAKIHEGRTFIAESAAAVKRLAMSFSDLCAAGIEAQKIAVKAGLTAAANYLKGLGVTIKDALDILRPVMPRVPAL